MSDARFDATLFIGDYRAGLARSEARRCSRKRRGWHNNRLDHRRLYPSLMVRLLGISDCRLAACDLGRDAFHDVVLPRAQSKSGLADSSGRFSVGGRIWTFGSISVSIRNAACILGDYASSAFLGVIISSFRHVYTRQEKGTDWAISFLELLESARKAEGYRHV